MNQTIERPRRRGMAVASVLTAIVLAACSGSESDSSMPAADGSVEGSAEDSVEGSVDASTILVRPDDVVAPIDRRIFGTNVAVWIFPEVLGDPQFHEVVEELGTTLLRFPGGSWSNDYEWGGCERREAESCSVPWASRASDLAGLMAATELPGLWTVAFN